MAIRNNPVSVEIDAIREVIQPELASLPQDKRVAAQAGLRLLELFLYDIHRIAVSLDEIKIMKQGEQL